MSDFEEEGKWRRKRELKSVLCIENTCEMVRSGFAVTAVIFTKIAVDGNTSLQLQGVWY